MNYPFRPSSLPALRVSPRFQPSSAGDAATLGADRHAALECLLNGSSDLLNILRDEDIAGVKWSHEYIVNNAPMADYVLETERKLELFRSGMPIMKGTADVICGDHLFDMKWRERDYDPQLAAYALALMQARKSDTVTVHILFAETQFAKCYTLTKTQAEDIVFPILDNVMHPSTVCVQSEYCNWCKLVTVCPVLIGSVNAVAEKLEVALIEDIENLTPSRLGATLSMIEAVTTWAEAAKEKIRDLALMGNPIEGYEVVERKGSREIAPSNINAAFGLLNIPVERFMQACKVSITNLESALAETQGLSKKDATNALNEALDGIIENKPSVKMLKKLKK